MNSINQLIWIISILSIGTASIYYILKLYELKYSEKLISEMSELDEIIKNFKV